MALCLQESSPPFMSLVFVVIVCFVLFFPHFLSG